MPEPKEAVGDGISLSDEDLYGGMGGNALYSGDDLGVVVDAADDLNVELIGAVDDGAETEEEKEEEKEESEDTSVGAQAPDKDDKGEVNDPLPSSSINDLWDPKRQERDQEHANDRKAWETEKAELALTVAELKGAALKASKAAEKDATVAEPKSPALDKLNEIVKDFGEESEASDVSNALKLLPAAVEEARAGGESQASKALEAKLEALEAKLEAVKAESEGRDAEDAESKAKAAQAKVDSDFKGMLGKLDAEFGAHLHNDAYTGVQAELVSLGYDESNRPQLDLLGLLFDKHYKELAVKNPKKKTPKRKKGNVPAGDSGSGGTSSRAPLTGSFEDKVATMYANGEFD